MVLVASSVLSLLSISQRIPYSPETKLTKILFVNGGKIRDAFSNQGQRGSPVVGATAGELLFTKFRPKSIVECPVIGRKTDDLPARVLTKGLANIGGGRTTKGPSQYGRVSQKHVQFEQDKFADRNIMAIL